MAVALYARVSTTRQAEKDLSIPDQLNQMRAWCKSKGYAVAMEYVEPGASATDDRRPIFQQMIADATLSPSPYDAIIVHSRSRFFRDLLQFLQYERSLKRAGVRLISITQETNNDPAGEMASKIFSVFDEYQSKENGKHTLRAMKENARQGFFNGSKPPYGYRTVETEAKGRRGSKKRLEIDVAEAAIVQRIFELYLNGYEGIALGAKGITEFLNDRGITLRGQRWTRGRVHEVLSNSMYHGEYWFNKHENKTKTLKPQSEWVKIAVPPIIEVATFQQVEARREARSPAKVPPRIVNSPTLLTGLLKCGHCNAGMTLATGKGGRYRYYKCNTRIGKGNHLCDSANVPMEKLDSLVISTLSDKVFTPVRVRSMIDEMKKRLREDKSAESNQLTALKKELNELEVKSNRLLEAVESGYLPMDATLHERAHKHQARRQAILIEMSGLRQQIELPSKFLDGRHTQAFCRVLRKKLTESKPLAKRYLYAVVSEIRLVKNEVTIAGDYRALADAVGSEKRDGVLPVPTSARKWLPDLGSNQGPAD
jgi:site-specific DNA recombinase